MEEATEALREESYDPPKPSLTISFEPPEAGAVLLNAQDWHVCKRAKGADEGLEEYTRKLKSAFKGALETAMRMRRIDTLHFVTSGDLVQVDGPQGAQPRARLRTLCVAQDGSLRRRWSWWCGASIAPARSVLTSTR